MDMYGEKVADASALIRQVSGKEYFDAFGVSTESVLELFIDCMEQVRKVEREAQAQHNASVVKMTHGIIDEQAARIADLEQALKNVVSAKNNHQAEEFARQALVAAPSAPAVEQQPVAEWVNEEQGFQYLQLGRLPDGTKLYTAQQAAPQAADTDKVREALSDEQIMRIAGDVRQRNAGAWPGDVAFARAVLASMAAQASAQQDVDKVREAILALPLPAPTHLPYGLRYSGGDMHQLLELAADTAASMAAQAPVREVPGWQPIETAPKDGNEVLLWLPAPYSRIAKARWFDLWENWQEGEFPSDQDEYCGIGCQLPTHYMPLPAAPIQPEVEKP